MKKTTLVCILAFALMILAAIITYYIPSLWVRAIVLIPIIFGGIYVIRKTIVNKNQ